MRGYEASKGTRARERQVRPEAVPDRAVQNLQQFNIDSMERIAKKIASFILGWVLRRIEEALFYQNRYDF